MPTQLFQQHAPTVVNVKDFPVLGDGIHDETSGIQAALASLPTVTVYANPTNNTGSSAVFHKGALFFPPGTYKIGSSGDIGNIGPFVSLLGPDHNSVVLDYHGSGDAIRLYNSVNPTSGTFDTLAGWAGKIDGLTIDGTNASAGAKGLHYGDTEGGVLGPDLHIRNFSGSGSVGLYMDNSVSWTENIWSRVTIFNCKTAVIFDVTSAGASFSFEYNHLIFKIYAFSGQNGVVLQNGAWFRNGSLSVLGNFELATSPQSNSCLTITGNYNGGQPYSQLTSSRLDIQVETNSTLLSGTNPPTTITYGDVLNNAIYNCVGVLNFGELWNASNWSVANSFAGGNFTFMGQTNGDTNIGPDVHGAFAALGAIIYSPSQGFSNGGMPLWQGDFFTVTLTQNMTVALQHNTAGPQRKTFLFTQAASGGPYTVTWPKPGSPTTSSPAVYWAGGTAPTMTATAGATDMYALETMDGIHWYGRTSQNMS
jgi:hypothetical protein